MNLAAILPHFPPFGFQSRPTRSQHLNLRRAVPEQRTMLRNDIITLENRRLQLRVLRGCVWITRDGCPADMVLAAGNVFDQQPGDRVLVQALEDAELLIACAEARAQNV